MMKHLSISLAVIALCAGIAACGSSADAPSLSGIQLIGTVSGTQPSLSRPLVAASAVAKADHDASPNCDTTDQANSFWVSPSAYRVALKKVTLLGSSTTGTADYTLLDIATPAEATEVDLTAAGATLTSSTTYPTAGTYDGIEIEVFHIGETIPMVVPAVNSRDGASTFTSATYETRGYFEENGNIQPRDVTIFAPDPADPTADLEYWINRKTDDADPYGLVAVTGTHPTQVLDLWWEANFWCENGEYVDGSGCTISWRDPMSICTRASGDCDPTVFNTDFTFTLADGTTELVIPSSATGLYTITFTFDVSETFTFWGDKNYSDPTSQAYGTFRVGYDCGYRIMFPDVTISMTES